MTAIKTKNIESALLKKGFRSESSHHEYFWLYIGERQTRFKTYLSHSIPEYGDQLLDKVKKQMGISKKQLVDFVDCRLTYEKYVAHLRQHGRIEKE